jgi:lysophospholipase L1-like esterase
VRSTFLSTALLAIFTLLGGNRASAQPPALVQEVRPATTSPPAHNFARWEKEIAAYEAADRKNPPKKGGVLFIGSSTIRLWKTLAEDFTGVNVVNRGFGGSEIVDSTHFADRIIFPYEPKQIFLRAGGNDIHAGRTPIEVANDFRQFVGVVHSRLPKTEIVYIAVNPAPVRWSENDKYQALNKRIREMAVEMSRVSFIDCYDVSLTRDGKARPELFIADMLHFNADGYKALAERVRPYIQQLATQKATPKQQQESRTEIRSFE